MDDTKLLYMEDMWNMTGEATVQEIIPFEDRMILVLDQTWFYPQGGGQPCDQGTIETKDSLFKVEKVRYFNKSMVVKHTGYFEKGTILPGQKVILKVDPVRRALMSRIHSAGHVIDIAVDRLGFLCKPGRGYHFPEGPFVEYIGELPDLSSEELRTKLEKTCEEIVQENNVIRIEFVTAKEMRMRGLEIPFGIPTDKPIRLVYFGEFCMPCGGTHVKMFQDIGKILIRKVSLHPELMRISYSV